MEDILDRYIHHLRVERNYSPFTLRNYSTDIRGFFHFLKASGIESLTDIDHPTMRRYLGWLLQRGAVRASISRKISALRSFFLYANGEGILKANPMDRVSAPKSERRLPSFLTSEEVLSLLKAPDLSTPQGLRDLAILEVLYATGLRVSEIVSLNVDRVDIEARQIRVWGKGSKERVVLIGEPAAKALEQYLALGRAKLLGSGNTNALFVNRYGKRIVQRRVQYLIKKYARKAGMSGKVSSPHMLRHTFATHMLNGGADLRVVQELLGHIHLSSTQIYTHISRSQMRSTYLKAHPRSREEKKTA